MGQRQDPQAEEQFSEAVTKGSLDYKARQIRRAFYRQFKSEQSEQFTDEDFWIEETFDRYVIVGSTALAEAEYFRVTFTASRQSGEIRFVERERWEIVELGYQDLPPSEAAADEDDIAEETEPLAEPRGVAGEVPAVAEQNTDEAEIAEETEPLAETAREIPTVAETGASEDNVVEETETLAEPAEVTAEGPPAAETEVAEAAAPRAEGRTFIETSTDIVLAEAVAGQPRTIEALVATAGVVNQNGRRYSYEVLSEAVDLAAEQIATLGRGRAVLLGEDAHPVDKKQTQRLVETIVVWESIWMDDNDVRARGRLIENSLGKDVIVTMEAGVLPGVSLRGKGMSQVIKEQGRAIEEVEWLEFTGIDLVLNPSFVNAGVNVFESTMEDQKQMDPEETTQEQPVSMAEAAAAVNPTVDIDELRRRIRAADEAEAAQQLSENQRREREDALASIREALRLPEDADLTQALAAQQQELLQLREAQQRQIIQARIEEAVADVAYPGKVRDSFLKFVGQPATMEQAEARIVQGRELFDGMAADIRLAAMGFQNRTGSGIEVLGPVIERDANTPAYARAAFEIAESLVASGLQPRFDLAQPRNRSEIYAQRYLKKFDDAFKFELLEESKRYTEALDSTILNLPTSILRAVIVEALPQLVAASVFDFGTIDQAPVKLWFKVAYEGETGSNPTVSDQDTVTGHDTWVALGGGGKRLDYGTVVVKSSDNLTTYVEGTDYVIDYAEGKIKTLSSGSIADGTTVKATYTYNAVRKGELQGIERGRVTLTSQTLEVAADRLAAEISNEAIVFSRSQLGWDATQQTLSSLVDEVARIIDANIFSNALNATLSVPNNSGGTWTAATDSLDDLYKKIGLAKALIANRLYEPTALVMSLNTAELLSNSTLFTASGSRSDAALDQAGYIGRAKGMPVFHTTTFPDSFIMPVNRELVMHRVFQPMTLKGPFPSYDANRKLVSAEQYYIEEYNGQITPVPGKGSYVRLA